MYCVKQYFIFLKVNHAGGFIKMENEIYLTKEGYKALQEKLDYLREVHGNVSFSGIVSANIKMDLTNKENYSILADCEDVYFIDLSDPLTRLTEKDYNEELNIKILDASWQLESQY